MFDKTKRNGYLDLFGKARSEFHKVVVGLDDFFTCLFLSLIIPPRYSQAGELIGSNLLVTAPSGVAKTLSIKVIAQICQLEFDRIQFTPDILPGDILGTVFPDPEKPWAVSHFDHGPVFTDLLLADEVNRATSRTQAALLQAMEERQVTLWKMTESLSRFFRLFATINPIEDPETANYPLPVAQKERFTVVVRLSRLSEELEKEVLRRSKLPPNQPQKVISKDDIVAISDFVKENFIDPLPDKLMDLSQRIVSQTWEDEAFVGGASTRIDLDIMRVGATLSFLSGEDRVLPSHMIEAARYVLPEKLVLADYSKDPYEEIERVIDQVTI